MERRQNTRAPGRQDLRMHAGEVECRVVDVSCSGLCFRTPAPPAEMSLVDIRLEVPLGATDQPDAGIDAVRCQGAVVRAESVGEDLHEVAIFFTQLDDAGRLALLDYVRRHAEPAST